MGHQTLDPRWRPLLEQVLADRDNGLAWEEAPRPGSVEAMHAFIDDAIRWAAGR